MATELNLVVDQGSTFTTTITAKDGKDVMDLTGLTPRSQMRKAYYTDTYIDIACEIVGDPTEGIIKLTVPPSATLGIRAGRYVYDVEVANATNDYVKRVVEGVVTITPQVTKVS